MAATFYYCERIDLFDKLRDPKWFHDFVEHQYKRVVFDMEPVVPVLSEYWIGQAHFRWTKDVAVVSSKEYGGRPLDHFKYAGFLCYWLRRCPPLSELATNPDLAIAGIRYRDPKKILVQYGNVFAAFDIGLRICRYWESARRDIGYSEEVRDKIMRFSIPQRSEYIEDICYTLAEKNISPHSLNMLYKSLFLAFRPPGETTT
jgi:hypothetical protein